MDKQPFKESKYENIGIDQLVIYAAAKILSNDEECTFERLVYEAFTLFPAQFGFQRYPEWPDSARINKAWLRCRTDRGWLSGNVKEGFTLTKAGEMVAKAVEKELKTGVISKRVKPKGKARERYEAILSYIKNSELLSAYNSDPNIIISEKELRAFLGGTLETPKRILRENLNLYVEAAKIYEDKSAIPFLAHCKETLKTMEE